MKTGLYEQVRHQTSVIAALFFAFALVFVLSGCEDNSPVSAPTSTMPGSDSEPSPPNESNSHQIPEYETDLELNDEEKEAVEGALVAFEGFFQSINKAYSGEFQTAEDFPLYASGSALKSIDGDVDAIEDGSYQFTGEVVPSEVQVQKVQSSREEQETDSVTVTFCFDLSKWSLTPTNEETQPSDDEFATMEHVIVGNADGWTVSEQILKAHKC